MKLLIASHNPAKVKEYKDYLSELSLETVSLSELGIKQVAVEDAETFEENALNKAKFYHKLTQFPTIADDGGLMIDALDGAPGVKSRYWAGYRMTDEEMIQSVIEKMKNFPNDKRTCHLVGVIVLVKQINHRRCALLKLKPHLLKLINK